MVVVLVTAVVTVHVAKGCSEVVSSDLWPLFLILVARSDSMKLQNCPCWCLCVMHILGAVSRQMRH